MHQELTTLRSMVDTRSRIGLVEPKTFMPDRFRKEKWPRAGELVTVRNRFEVLALDDEVQEKRESEFGENDSRDGTSGWSTLGQKR